MIQIVRCPDVNERLEDTEEVEEANRVGAELYSQLVSLLSAEALMMVRSVNEGGGLLAWNK